MVKCGKTLTMRCFEEQKEIFNAQEVYVKYAIVIIEKKRFRTKAASKIKLIILRS